MAANIMGRSRTPILAAAVLGLAAVALAHGHHKVRVRYPSDSHSRPPPLTMGHLTVSATILTP